MKTDDLIPDAFFKQFIVEHVPTIYAEPKTPAEILASVEWKTTNVYDITAYYSGSKVSAGASNPINPAQIDEAAIASANLPVMNPTLAPAAGYSGDAFYTGGNNLKAYFNQVAIAGNQYFSNGDFLITPYNDKNTVRSRGNWYVSLDGKVRTLNALNAEGGIMFNRDVSIHELTPEKFTYDIVHGAEGEQIYVLRVEHIKK